MENGRLKILAALVVAMALFWGAASAAVDPHLVLSNFTLSNPVTIPGGSQTLSLTLQNIVSTPCAEQVGVQLSVSYPLSVSGSATKYFPQDVCATDSAAQDTLPFQLTVDPLAATGTYPVTLTTTYQKDFLQYSTTSTIYMKVEGTAVLNAQVVGSNPVDFYPGDSGTISVRFSNVGTQPIQSALAILTSTGVQVKWAGSSQQLGQIPAHSSVDEIFNVEAPKYLTSGNYPLDLQVAYTDEQNNNSTSQFQFSMPVKPKAQFTAAGTDGETLVINQNAVDDITLTNTGTQTANQLKVSIQPVYPFSTDGTVRYIQSVAPGQSVVLSYRISVDKQATEGSELLTFNLAWQDPDGNKLSDTTDFALQVRSPTLLEQALGFWYLIVAVILVGAFFLRKRLSKKKG